MERPLDRASPRSGLRRDFWSDSGQEPVRTSVGHASGGPQKALCGGIPGAVLEPLVRSWSHFVGIYRQKLTRSIEN